MVLFYCPCLSIYRPSWLKTSTNVLTLLFRSHPSSLSATATTNSFSHPKRNITPTSFLPPLILLAVFGKLSINYSASSLPYSASSVSLADSFFAFFFTDKIHKLCLSLAAISTVLFPHSPSPPVVCLQFSSLWPASKSEISKILPSCPNKQQLFTTD